MSQLEVTVEPDQLELRPGEAAEVTVSVEPTKGSGRVVFPVHGSKGQGQGTVNLNLIEAAVFMDPRTEPGNLPVTVELLRSDALSATYRITARRPELKRSEKRKLKRGGG